MKRRLLVKELSESTVTRPRGHEAYRELLEYLKTGEPLEIDLRGQELISGSFLDEIIINLKASNLLDKVTFLLSAEDTYKRLARIAATRNAQIFYRPSEHGDRRVVEPKAFPDLPFRRARSATGGS